MIDLGHWAAEDYKVPGPSAEAHRDLPLEDAFE